MSSWPNKRPGVEAGLRVVLAYERPRSRATQAERSAFNGYVHVN